MLNLLLKIMFMGLIFNVLELANSLSKLTVVRMLYNCFVKTSEKH